MYVRFGDLPEGGRSRNDETGQYEAGVSVYHAEWANSDHDVLCVLLCNEGDVAQLHILEDRSLYLVEGIEVGKGSDGEPLLADAVATPLEGVEAITYSIEQH
jgi:hypothetical protein